MNGVLKTAASVRGVLSLSLLLGSLTGLSSRGTLAYYTSEVKSDTLSFTGGVVDIAGRTDIGGSSTASVLANQSFSWTTIGASDARDRNGTTGTPGGDPNVCKTILPGTDLRTQGMVPGQYCVAPLDINNDNQFAVDAWMRFRLVRQTPYAAANNALQDTPTEALNDRLKVYMHEYTGWTLAGSMAAGTVTGAGFKNTTAGRTQYANKLARDQDCTTASYKPEWTQATAGGAATALGSGTGAGTVAGTVFRSLFGSSAGTIPSRTLASQPANVTGARRDAITTLTDAGRTLGAHPGVSALTVSSSAGANGAAQDQSVLDLVTADENLSTGLTMAATGSGTSTYTRAAGTAGQTAPASNNGLRLLAGTTGNSGGTISSPAPGAAATEANMRTAYRDASDATNRQKARNTYNLLGNDEVTNPNRTNTGLTTLTGGVSGPNPTDVTRPNGTQPHGTNGEAEILAGQRRFYCIAIFLPADTDGTISTVYGQGVGTSLNQSFPAAFDFTTGQYTGTSNLGAASGALTAANTQGDNAIQMGALKYQLVVSAAQKAGRTTD